MNKMPVWLILLLVAAFLGFAALVWFLITLNGDSNTASEPSLLAVQEMPTIEGFTRADGPRDFTFPADHGAHPDFQTEWWYYTGNLETSDGRRFGYQLTFFRRALTPPDKFDPTGSTWRTNQIYMAHFAISNVQENDFYYEEKISRGGGGLAGAKGTPVFKVWLENWKVTQMANHQYQVSAGTDEYDINLELIDVKGPVLQGDQGYSRKGAEAGNASYYISQTRLETTGKLRVGEKTFEVSGLSWMDHEFSTSALGAGQVGWDWFSVQVDDGSELMVFSLRNADPDIPPFVSGTVIQQDGTTRVLSEDEISVEVEDSWTSPTGRVRYPSGWRILIPSENMELSITPVMSNQELHTFITYWEGAVDIRGVKNGNRVTGFGYVELTGYAHSMQGEF